MSHHATISSAFLSVQAQRLIDKAQQAANDHKRFVLGIVGIPASGKSSLTVQLMEYIEAIAPSEAALLPMDGYHLTNHKLDELGLRDRKGSPHTFDAEGYVQAIEAVKPAGVSLSFPVYDRAIHDPKPDAGQIESSHQLIVTEGNYLLLDQPPWDRLGQVINECWWLDTPTEQAKEWMIKRHVQGGRTEEDARSHYEHSDAANTQLILEHSREPDLIIQWSRSE